MLGVDGLDLGPDRIGDLGDRSADLRAKLFLGDRPRLVRGCTPEDLCCRFVGIFPNEASIMRLIGAVLFEANDDWQTSSRYMMVEAFAQIDKEEIDPILSITTKAA